MKPNSMVFRCAAIILFSICSGAYSEAQVILGAAVNGASLASPSLPNGKLAPGMLFSVFGSGMGPTAIAKVAGFPLPTRLPDFAGGTSVSVTVGSTTVDCPMIFSTCNADGAMLPNNVPLGNGTLQVTFNGVTSEALNITVVAHSFGIFALN
jgi:uncharacterized protein (TIGR03437 family)